MIPQFWIAITGLIAGLQGPILSGEAGEDASSPIAAYGPPAPAELEEGTKGEDAPAESSEEPAAEAEGAKAAAAEDEAGAEVKAAEAKAAEAKAAEAKAESESGSATPEEAGQEPRRLAEAEGGDDSPSAEEVVEGVQEFYEETEHLTAVFRQVYTNVTFGRESVSDGRVWLKKPGKMRWDYQNRRTNDVHKSFISDGSVLWALEHDNEQAFRKGLEDTVLPVAVTFLTGEGELSRDFEPSLDHDEDYGDPDDYVLELTPREPSAQYKKLWLVVDPDDFRAKQSIVLEDSGNTNHFRFFEPDTERTVKSSWFEVDEDALSDYRIIEAEDQ